MAITCWDRSLNTRKVLSNAAPNVSRVITRIEEGETDISVRGICMNSQASALLGKLLLGSNVTRLALPGCRIGDTGCEYIGRALLENPIIEWLNVSNNNIVMLPKSFINGVASGGVCGLNVSHNSISRDSLSVLCSSIYKNQNSTIHDIDFSNTGALYSIDALKLVSDKVATLRIGHNSCWVNQSLPFKLDGSSPITTLDLCFSRISDDECQLVAGVFDLLKSLERINLKNNLIAPSGLVLISEGLKKTSSLREISLSSNPLSGIELCSNGVRSGWYNEKGLLALCSAISQNRGLRKLDLSECLLGFGSKKFYDGSDHGGVTLLCDAVKLNVTMRAFYLTNNNFNELTMKTLRRVSGGRVSFNTPDTVVGTYGSLSSPLS